MIGVSLLDFMKHLSYRAHYNPKIIPFYMLSDFLIYSLPDNSMHTYINTLIKVKSMLKLKNFVLCTYLKYTPTITIVEQEKTI